MIKTFLVSIALFVAFFSCINTSLAEITDVQRSNELLSVLLELEALSNEMTARIEEMDRDIQKSESIISRSEKLIRLAMEKGNKKAETIARQALITAREAKRRNLRTLQAIKLYREMINKKITALKALIQEGEKTRTEDTDPCREIEAQLERDKNAIKRWQQTLKMTNEELENWASTNDEAAREALKVAIEGFAEAISPLLKKKLKVLDDIQGEIKKWEGKVANSKQAEASLYFLNKLEKARSAYRKALAMGVTGKRIEQIGTAKELYEFGKNHYDLTTKLVHSTDTELTNALSDPEVRALLSDTMASHAKKYMAMLGKKIPIVEQGLPFGAFVVNYTYNAWKWGASALRISQFSKLTDLEIRATDALGKQIRRTMDKLKECRKREQAGRP